MMDWLIGWSAVLRITNGNKQPTTTTPSSDLHPLTTTSLHLYATTLNQPTNDNINQLAGRNQPTNQPTNHIKASSLYYPR
jgi:hypothetical protein